MPKLTQHTKVERVLRFLTSFSRTDVTAIMALRGFAAADREEGFALLDKAVGRDLALSDKLAPVDKSLITAIDAWENIWFDVAGAALARSFPEIHARILDKLPKTSGPMVVLNVKILLDRLAELEQSEDPTDQAALALLAKRGLDQEQRDYATSLIKRTRTEVAEPSNADAQAQDADLEQAVANMWAWYQDWAKTARTVVKSKRMRISMGLSTVTRGSDGSLEEDELDGDELDDDDSGELDAVA